MTLVKIFTVLFFVAAAQASANFLLGSWKNELGQS
jgi:hypothetical protein